MIMELATGWLPELPDARDWDAMSITDTLGVNQRLASDFIDIREYCSPIENQGRLGSCVAQAVAGLAEYMERVYYKRHVDVSRLFLYKIARQLDGLHGDTGSRIRTAMKGLKLFGAPPERYWPYDISKFDDDPNAFSFAYGQSLQAISYYRIDQGDRSRADILSLTKRFIASGWPVAFGFSVYTYNSQTGEFPYPEPGQQPRGGHAIMAVGYDDARVITKTTGALLIRNSWGTGWGDKGYGWLPYDYVLNRLSADFWIMTRKEVVLDS